MKPEDALFHISPEKQFEKMYFICWMDSSGSEGWNSWDNMPKKFKGVLCCTVGFVYSEDDDFITLLNTTSEEHYMGRISIPQKAVVFIHDITPTTDVWEIK